MKKKHLLPQAERQFIKENKSVSAIAESLGVSASTISRWAKANDWEARQADYAGSTLRVAEKLRKLLAEDIDSLDKLDNGSMDRIMKAVKSVKEIDREVDMLANTIEIMDQFTNFLQAKHSRTFAMVQEVLPDFLIYMREKYK